jgi:3-oxoacyl-[acyl-carrier-protein] synthase I
VSFYAIRSVGAITPLGEDAPATVGSIYTEARELSDLPLADENGLPMKGAKTPIPDNVSGIERLAVLGSYALGEAIDGAPANIEMGLVVCVPSQEDEQGLLGQSDALLARLASEARLTVAAKARRVFPAGRSAVFEALHFARSALHNGLSFVCVLGIDCLVSKARLERLLDQRHVLGPQGLVPGEAAAAIVLAQQPGTDSLAVLAGMGTTDEPSNLQRDRPNRGRGLVSAIDKAVAEARLANPIFSALVHDMAGSREGLEELNWAKTCQALSAQSETEILCPYNSVGETGAASGILSLATLAFLIDKNVIAGPGLCLLASEGGKRGAAILTPPQRTAKK